MAPGHFVVTNNIIYIPDHHQNMHRSQKHGLTNLHSLRLQGSFYYFYFELYLLPAQTRQSIFANCQRVNWGRVGRCKIWTNSSAPIYFLNTQIINYHWGAEEMNTLYTNNCKCNELDFYNQSLFSFTHSKDWFSPLLAQTHWNWWISNNCNFFQGSSINLGR